MEKNRMNKFSKRRFFLIPGICTLILFCTAIFLMNHYSKKMIESHVKENNDYLSEINKQIATTIDNRIYTNQVLINSISTMIGITKDFESKEISEILKTERIKHNLIRIAIIKPNGNYTENGKTINVSSRTYFQEALKGYFTIGNVFLNENNDYYINHDAININKIYQEKFTKNVNEILNSEFVKNIIKDIFIKENQYIPRLSIGNNTKYYNENKNYRKTIYEYIAYIAKNNLIQVYNGYSNKNYKEFLNEMFNTRIPRNLISEYFQSIIDNNIDTKKDIIISNEKNYTKKCDFYLNDEREAFVLVKK